MYENWREFAQAVSQASAFFASMFLFSALFFYDKKHITLDEIRKGSLRLKASFFLLFVGIMLLFATTIFSTASVSKFPEYASDSAIQEAAETFSFIYYEFLLGVIAAVLGLLTVIGVQLKATNAIRG